MKVDWLLDIIYTTGMFKKTERSTMRLRALTDRWSNGQTNHVTDLVVRCLYFLYKTFINKKTMIVSRFGTFCQKH